MSANLFKLALRGTGAAAVSALVAAPALAVPQSGAEQLRLEAPQAASAQPLEIAQTYVPLVGDVGTGGFEQAKGWYFTLGAGASAPQDRTTRVDVGPDNTSIPIDTAYGGGFALDTGIGYDFGAIRTELTYSYNRASLNDLSVNYNGVDFSTSNVSGAVNKNDVFASAYIDFPFGRWAPYIGGGIGYSNLSTPSFTIENQRYGNLSYGGFGWQAKAGISYALSYNWDLYAEGVYQGMSGHDTDSNVNFGSFNNWGGKLGFRYRFARPAVAVVEAAPAPAPAPVYMEPAPAPAPEPAPPVRGLW
jgi:opacity protein-like surface antigen